MGAAVKRINWTRILTILLAILAMYALLYITGTVLFRFRHAIALFVLGAMVAYVLTPLVNQLEGVFRLRWVAILFAYALFAVLLFALGVLLFTPFVQQSQSLIDNLHTPSSASLQTVTRVENGARRVVVDLKAEKSQFVATGTAIPLVEASRLQTDIGRLHVAIRGLERGTISGPSHESHPTNRPRSGRAPPNPPPQTTVPASYIKPIGTEAGVVSAEYAAATRFPGGVDPVAFNQALSAAKRATADASHVYQVMSTTPILLIRSQTWLDQHGIRVDLHSKFGQAANQVSNQGTLILDNAVTIVSETANTLVNVALILIIAFYFLSDGRRLVRSGLELIPSAYHDRVWYFVSSLDRVVGGYIRGQLFLSALAGVLGGGGAALLGVPYPLLIGIMTFILESVPVIGPIVAVFPAVIFSLFFVPLLTTIILLVWNVIYQQIVTNVLGPRVLGFAVGIHPLETILAVLIGYPLGGLLGAFLAVPVMGILHIVVRELYGYFVLGQSLPTAVPDLGERIGAPGETVPGRPGKRAASG